MPLSRKIVAVIDWGASASLKENARFMQLAGARDQIRPRGWQDGPPKFRSLIVRADGSGELQRFSTAAVTRRLNGEIVQDTAGKTRMSQRG